jgi:hypothetical protein
LITGTDGIAVSVSGGRAKSGCEMGSSESTGQKAPPRTIYTMEKDSPEKTKGVARSIGSQSRYPSIVPRYKEKVESNVTDIENF